MNERILEPNDEFMRNATEINDKLRTISKKIIGHSLSTLIDEYYTKLCGFHRNMCMARQNSIGPFDVKIS